MGQPVAAVDASPALDEAERKRLAKVERSLVRKIDFFILSFLCLQFYVNYLDRVSVTNAYVSGMAVDLNFKGNEINQVGSCFVAGYALFQIPQNLLLLVVPPRILFPVNGLLFGGLTMLGAAVKTKPALYALSFFKGVAEASTFVGAHYVLGSWYVSSEIAKRGAVFVSFSMLASISSGLIQWRWLFLICGLITIPISAWGFFYFPDTPERTTAAYLTEEERQLAITRVQRSAKPKFSGAVLPAIKRVFGRWHIWMLCPLWILGGIQEYIFIDSFMPYWMLAQKVHGKAVYTVSQINTYPTGIPAAAILVLIVTAVWTDYTGKRYQVNFLIGASVLVSASILINYDRVSTGVKFLAFYLSAIPIAGQSIIYAWANELAHGDDLERTLLLSAMNLTAYVVGIGFGLTIFSAAHAPRWHSGIICLFVSVPLLLVVTIATRYLQLRDQKKNALEVKNDSTPELDQKEALPAIPRHELATGVHRFASRINGVEYGMTEDIFRSVPRARVASTLDLLERLLTHRSPLVRRGSFLLFLLFIYYLTSTIHALGSFPPPVLPAAPSSTKSPQTSLAATPYVPAPPTVEQARVYLKLLDLIEGRKSAFPAAPFKRTALSSDTTRVVGVTAVVLHWKRRKGLQLVLKHISRYPFIREIIVWNNNEGIELVADDFVLSSPPESNLSPPVLRIYNSPSNVHDAGKHLACSLASYKHCYFNDDDWLNIYMDSLYVKYLECCAGGGGAGRGGSGGRIASNTMPIIHLEHRRWRFENPEIDLHTGFTWLGTGAFAPRHLSVRFLNQQSAAPVLLQREQTLVSDMYFSLWANSYPEQMPNNLVPIDVEGGEVGWSRGAGVDQWAVVYGNTLDAVRKLFDILLIEEPHLCPDPFPLAPPPPESHTRAPCGNDGCLFSTSISPFPPPSALTYPPLTARKPSFWSRAYWKSPPSNPVEIEGKFDPYDIASIKAYEAKWSLVDGGWPTDQWWTEKGSWHLAVDGKGAETCWESWRRSLDLENIVAWQNTGAGPEAWEILTESRRLSGVPHIRPLGPSQVEVTIPLEPIVDFYGEDIPIRKLKFVSRGKKRWKLSVCGFSLDGWDV
ncbi:hypothetical protein MNV49_002422 [Pseudohyphozyma bogoriensis]|nr:hypothetical protein MNV49_002422 [Pseudohyphozyma bogoriensis]